MKSLNFIYPEPQKLVLVEEEVPALGPNTVLVENIVSHVSIGTELFCYRGVFDPGSNWENWVKYPFRPGYSMAGRVIETGKDVVDFKPGDLVRTTQPHGQYSTIEYGENEINNIINRSIYKVPGDLCLDEVIWESMCCVAIVGCRKAKIEFGENAAVIGAGAIGQLTAQYAKLCGAQRVVSIDTVQKRLDCALKSGGATDALCMDVKYAISAVEELLGAKPEVVFDSTGNFEVLKYACDMVNNCGRVIVNGDTPEPSKQELGFIVYKSLEIHGVHGNFSGYLASYPWISIRNSEMNLEFIRQKRINVKQLISHRYSPREAPEVYARLLHDRAFCTGVVFDWIKQ
jgi:2-desacetyl-2-hydroxyethyl bacteriochlorophyllide A dehydrogenase